MAYKSLANKTPVLLATILIVSFFIYYPASLGGFVYDDLPNIVTNNQIHIDSVKNDDLLAAISSGESGPLKRPVSMLSFALNYYFSGLNPTSFKLVNIIIHLVNGVLIFLLTRMILETAVISTISSKIKEQISLAVTALWLLHPINISSVVYTVQRMNELAAFFSLAGLVIFIWGRINLHNGKGGRALITFSFLICGSLAILSKENGALIYIFIGLLEILLFRFSDLQKKEKFFLAGLYSLFIAIPLILISVTLILEPDAFLNGYQQQPFSLYERLLTECRVIWIYIYMILIPDVTQYSVHHDDIVISQGLLSPSTTLFSILGILSLITASFKYNQKLKIFSFGILFFLSGHLIESTILPLQIIFEHRNYLPSYGILLILAYYLLDDSISVKSTNLRRILLTILIISFAICTYIKSSHWENTDLLSIYELEHNPSSSRLNYEAGKFYAEALDSGNVKDRTAVYNKAERYFRKSAMLDSNNIEANIGMIILSSSNGYQPDPSVIDKLSWQLSNNPISITGLRSMAALMNCHRTTECIINENVINIFINSILENTHLYGKRMENLYSEIIEYNIARGNYDVAFNVVNRGLILDEDSILLHLMFIRLLILTDNKQEARQQLAELKTRNIEGYEKDIEMLENILPGH